MKPTSTQLQLLQAINTGAALARNEKGWFLNAVKQPQKVCDPLKDAGYVQPHRGEQGLYLLTEAGKAALEEAQEEVGPSISTTSVCAALGIPEEDAAHALDIIRQLQEAAYANLVYDRISGKLYTAQQPEIAKRKGEAGKSVQHGLHHYDVIKSFRKGERVRSCLGLDPEERVIYPEDEFDKRFIQLWQK